MRGSNIIDDDDVDVFAKDVPADLPVHPVLTAKVNADLVVNKKSQVWLAYDQPFSDVVEWAEYDVDRAAITFVMRGGKVQDLGITIHKPMRKYLRLASKIDLMLVRNKKIEDFGRVPLLVRETSLV